MIRIVIAEDQQMLRGALSSLLQLEDDMEVVAEASNGKEALEMIKELKPNVCILDIEMPGLTGLEVAKTIKALGMDCKVMIVTTFTRPGYLQAATHMRVDGYLLKDEPIAFLVDAIRKIKDGQQIISPELATTLFQHEQNPLTEREQDVLRLAQEGQTTRQIAKSLYLTTGTVRNYLSVAIQKLDADSRHRAIIIAKEKGWI